MVEFVNMKDAGDTDRLTVDGMEKGEENTGGETEPVCVFKVWAEKQGQENPFCWPVLYFRGEGAQDVLYVRGTNPAMRKRVAFRVTGEMRKCLHRICDSRHWDRL